LWRIRHKKKCNVKADLFRVCMIAPMPFFEDRGAPLRVLGECQALAHVGHKLAVVSYHLGRSVPGIKIDRIPSIPWYQRTQAGPSWHKPYLDALLLLKALKTLKSDNYDLVHAHLHEGLLISNVLRALGLDLPILFDAQGSLVGEMLAHEFVSPGSLRESVWAFLEKQLVESCRKIVTSSRKLRDDLIRTYGLAPKLVTYIPDAVDTRLFDPERHSGMAVRERYGLRGPVIVYTGLLSKHQGIDFLIEDVAPKVLKSISDASFLIVGFPERAYREKARSLGMEENFIFTGKVKYNEVPEFLAAADVAVAPKFMISGEANLKIMPYMAMNLPIVALDYPQNREILNTAGVISTPDRFAEDLMRLLRSPELCA
jgi:glycosyltransferase involved in cell wall biosynthesis